MNFWHSIYTMNGKSVEVDNTDAEGRLVLAGMILFSWYVMNKSLIFLFQTLSTTRPRSTNHILWSTWQPLQGKYPPHAIAWYRHFTSISSAIEVALGQIYSGVFSVRYCQLFFSIYYFWWLNLNVEFGRAMEWSWGSRSCWTWPFMAYAPWRWVWSSDPFFKRRSPKRQYYPFFLGGALMN